MTEREQDLQRRLDEALRRLDALEQRQPAVIGVHLENPPRNALQSVSDWWHGGSSQGARSRHMRMNY